MSRKSDNLKMSLVELASRCDAVIEARQQPLRARQKRLQAMTFGDSSSKVSEIVAEASRSEDASVARELLLKAGKILVDDEAGAAARQLAIAAAEALKPKIEEIGMLRRNLHGLDRMVSVIVEISTKIAMANVQSGSAGYVDAALERGLTANANALRQTLSDIKAVFNDAGVTEAADQFEADLGDLAEHALAMEV